MRYDDIGFQVETFLNWNSRFGGELDANFKWWAQGKDFVPEDEQTIWMAVQEALAAVKMPRDFEKR